MESSRPGETSTTANLLAALPHELQLMFFKHVRAKDIGTMQQTCHYYNNLLMDNTLWDAQHTKDFPITPFNGDNKNQYHAEFLFHRVLRAPSADKKQIRALIFRRFLQQQHKTWTHYYRGLAFFRGFGVKTDHQVGFGQLLSGLDQVDYRAAVAIARVLVEAKIENPELYAQLMLLFDKTRQATMLELILNTYKEKIMPVGKLLARMYTHGIVVEADFEKAEAYYLATKPDANELGELGRLKFDSLPSDLTYEHRADRTVTYLKSFRGKLPAKPLESVINYWAAYLALTQGEDGDAIVLLRNTPELPFAKIFLGHLLENHGQPRQAVQELVEILDSGEPIARDLFDIQVHHSPLPDCIQNTIEITGCGKIEIADKVSAAYRENTTMEEAACDPYIVWWIQLAAQSGCVESLAALNSVDARQYPYICYALAVIHEFGILHSETVEPKHDRAEYYLNFARTRNLDIYVLTGIGQNFGCEEVINFLQTRLNTGVKNKL